MHHQSVNKSPSLFSLAAIRSMFLFVSSRIPVFSVIPPGGAYGRSLAKAGIPEIPASRRSDNMESHPHSVPSNFNFSILNFQFLSPRLLLTLLILPFIFALDLVYFTLARPGCAACGSLSGFLSTSSLTLTMINQNDTITSAFHSIKTIVARI